jgi:hypothetical protein
MTSQVKKYMPSFAELVDRLTIVQQKENVNPNPEFAKEIKDILHDIDLDIKNGVTLNADIIRAIVVLTLANQAIWINEDAARGGEGENNLILTHSLNGTRSTSKTKIQNIIGGRVDPKLNCLAADEKPIWNISW